MPAIAPLKTLTFTISKVPVSLPHRKTIERLMRMQPAVRRGLKRAAKIRAERNNIHPRGGRMWNARIKASRIVHAQRGASFTLMVTPQIVADLKSVEKYLAIS